MLWRVQGRLWESSRKETYLKYQVYSKNKILKRGSPEDKGPVGNPTNADNGKIALIPGCKLSSFVRPLPLIRANCMHLP